MTPETQSALSDLIGSRICHDLISPLGAISNGLELLEMSGLARSTPELAMISDSIESANARVRFFRVAFGAAKPGQQISQHEVIRILADLEKGARCTVSWEVEGACERPEVKLAFLLIMCMESSMPRGGVISIRQNDGEWSVQGNAEPLAVDPEQWQMLGGAPGTDGIIPALVQFALAPMTARAMNRRLMAELDEFEVLVRF